MQTPQHLEERERIERIEKRWDRALPGLIRRERRKVPRDTRQWT